MKSKTRTAFIFIGCLIAVTCAAMAYSNRIDQPNMPGKPIENTAKSKVVTLTGSLTQNKIYTGGDGNVSLSLTLAAADVFQPEKKDTRHADMVVVLDRSGSMDGKKIADAKKAIDNLLACLSQKDRIALISYSDGVQLHSELVPVTGTERDRLSSTVRQIYAGGGTNLGAGLQQGINTLLSASKTGIGL